MANRILTPSIIAKTAVRILENELGISGRVYRGYEDEFAKNVNGYSVGDTISVRRPTDFTVRDGAVAVKQDVVEGKVALQVNKQKGIDFGFSSKDLTLEIDELGERVIRPAMIQLANQVDKDVLALSKDVPNWVGTPGQTVKTFADFSKGAERLDEFGVAQSDRSAFLAPADFWGLVGTQTNLYVNDIAKGAYREGSLGNVAGIETFMAQNVTTLTTGSRSGASNLINGSITAATITYDAVKDTMVQTIGVDGLGGATQTIKAGDVLTIAGVYAVNSVTKEPLPFLKQFVVTADATAVGSAASITISPAMIWSGAQQTVSVQGVTDLDNQAVTWVGAASSNFRQNLMFHRNAFALVMVPMAMPTAAVNAARETYKGISARLVPYYDGTNDVSNYRLDILYGVKTIDPRAAVRLSGSA